MVVKRRFNVLFFTVHGESIMRREGSEGSHRIRTVSYIGLGNLAYHI
jgi:hypothetical protein